MIYRTIGSAIILFALTGCSTYFRAGNIRAVEKLRQQLSKEQYEKVYRDSSKILQAQVTQADFIERMRKVSSELKEVDPDITWQRVEESPEPAVYNDETWSSLRMEKDGRKITIQLDWDPGFQLCGMTILGDIPDRADGRVFLNCD